MVIMSICLILFTIWLFLVKCNHNNNLFVLQECGDFTWRVFDCEELSGGYSQEVKGIVSGKYFLTTFYSLES